MKPLISFHQSSGGIKEFIEEIDEIFFAYLFYYT